MRLPLLLAVLLVPGCATMSEGECRSANWFAVGLEDGARGTELDRLGAHRSTCAEYGVVPDAARYAEGRREGLRTFCNFERGRDHGRAGRAFVGDCPADLQARFAAGYNTGRELRALDARLGDVNGEIQRTKRAIAEPGNSPRARSQLAARLEDLSREAGDLERRLFELERRR